MRRTIQAECFSCHEKMSMNFMPRAVVNGSEVLLCKSCNWHFESSGYTPQPIIFPPTSIHCDQCKRLYTKVDIYQVNGMKLCLPCESLVMRDHTNKRRDTPKRRFFSWKTIVLGLSILVCIIALAKREEIEEYFNPLHTTQQEVSDYVQAVTNPLNELNNQLMIDLGMMGGNIGQEKAADYEQQLNRISAHIVTEEEELLELMEGEEKKIEILKKMIITSQLADPVERSKDIEALVNELREAHEQGNQILIGLFDMKEIDYDQKEGEWMHYYYTKVD